MKEQEKRGLPKEAYGNCDGDDYQPYISPKEEPPEFTFKAVFLGVILAVVFGAANAYLGLKVGMTVSASIPAAVISMGVLRTLAKSFGLKVSILENNMAQTVGSAGESLAAGVIFTIPALILMGVKPSLFQIFLLALLGGWLGVLFMIPLRRFLIVREHGKLPYPEGAACAEVLVAGEAGGSKAKTVFAGVTLGAIYKILMDKAGFFLWKEEVEWHVPYLKKGAFGFNVLPALLGVGYIIGPKIAAFMLAGAVLGWLGLIPFIAMLGENLPTAVYPSTVPIAQMDCWAIWNNYLRYIGAGAVAFGGVVSLLKALPVIFSSFKVGMAEIFSSKFNKSKADGGEKRTQRDLPLNVVMIFVCALSILIWLLPQVPLGLLGTILVVLFTFFFVTVSSRIVGLVGSSSNPASGMTIATLLATSLILAACGYSGTEGAVAAISVGAIACIGICIAGDTSQDLKTGFLVGATPRRQQIGELIGVLGSALFVGGTLYVLHTSYGIGSKDLAAPQATLMKMVVEGVLNQSLPWGFVLFGAFSALAVELMGIGSLPFAIGLYLPIHLSTPIMLGGLIRYAFEEWRNVDEPTKDCLREDGILYSSGLIAGDALLGVLLAPLVYFGKTPAILMGWMPEAEKVRNAMFLRSADTASFMLFLCVAATLIYVLWRKKEPAT